MGGDAPRVSGTVMLDQLALMRELYGRAVVDDALASLAPRFRVELDNLLRGGWCSIMSAYELKKAVAERVPEDVFVLQRKVVRVGIERTLTTFWRFFLVRLSDRTLARRTPLLYSRAFDRGGMELKSLSPGGALLELSGWPDIPQFDLVGLMVGIETVFTLAGRKQPHVDSARRGDLVTLHASWKT